MVALCCILSLALLVWAVLYWVSLTFYDPLFNLEHKEQKHVRAHNIHPLAGHMMSCRNFELSRCAQFGGTRDE